MHNYSKLNKYFKDTLYISFTYCIDFLNWVFLTKISKSILMQKRIVFSTILCLEPFFIQLNMLKNDIKLHQNRYWKPLLRKYYEQISQNQIYLTELILSMSLKVINWKKGLFWTTKTVFIIHIRNKLLFVSISKKR